MEENWDDWAILHSVWGALNAIHLEHRGIKLNFSLPRQRWLEDVLRVLEPHQVIRGWEWFLTGKGPRAAFVQKNRLGIDTFLQPEKCCGYCEAAAEADNGPRAKPVVVQHVVRGSEPGAQEAELIRQAAALVASGQRKKAEELLG